MSKKRSCKKLFFYFALYFVYQTEKIVYNKSINHIEVEYDE